MKILAVDTSSSTAAVAIISDGVLVGEYILNSGKTHSQKLLPMIELLLKDCNIKSNEIDAYACCSGPGSFTGLRIGAATIKAMAQVFDKPVIGVPSLDILAYGLYNCDGVICPVIDAQRQTVYSSLYKFRKGKLIKIEDFRVISVDKLFDYLKNLNEKVSLIGDGTYMFSPKITNQVISIVPNTHILPRASCCGSLAQEMLEVGRYSNYKEFIPQYIRKSQAEVEYEKKQQVTIEAMKLEDVDSVFEIECCSFKTPWTKQAFVDEINNNKLCRYVVGKHKEKIVGYGGMWFVMDEAHITNVAVHPQYKGQTVGQKIVQNMIELAIANKIKAMTLEVRPSNIPAKNLYKKMGFYECGLRKGYYADTGEDAIIMWKEI